MLKNLFGLGRPFLLALDPECAHELTLRALQLGIYPRCHVPDDPRLAITTLGLEFSNPLGIAAGFDKDARVPDAILGLGFGFAEIGTLTPEPQKGNPKPRLFRLIRDHAVINRLGFNNSGHNHAAQRLEQRSDNCKNRGIVGVNIGANKLTEDKAADYVLGLEVFYDKASYFMVNISSPNTPGLRDLQAPAALNDLLSRIMARRAALVKEGQPKKPVVVKIAPDLAEADLPAICEQIIAHEVDAVAISNTTLARPPGLDQQISSEAGGLSGRPLFHRSTAMLARVYQLIGSSLPLIGIGGIDSGETALAKIEAGATLIQLYTGLIYEGPKLIDQIKSELSTALDHKDVTSIADLVGTRAEEWAAKPLDG